MAEIAEINGIAVGNISKVNGISKSGLTNVQGFTFPAGGTPTTYLAKQISWGSGAADGSSGGYGLGSHPTNWESATSHTIYGSTTADRQWTTDTGGTTSSSSTGPSAGHDSSASDGREAASTDDYIYTEVSGQFNKRFLLRTPEFDFSSALSNSTLQLEFWFHMYGSNIGNLGVAATDSSTSAADDTLGLHFTSDTAGGATIVYWDDDSDDGSSTTTALIWDQGSWDSHNWQ